MERAITLTGGATKRVGDTCEAFVLATLVNAGLRVLVPWGDNAAYDLVVDFPGRFVRIQCKTGRLSARGSVLFATRRIGRDTTRVRYYSADEIDYFGVWCMETGAVYLIPLDELGECRTPSLRVEIPSPGSTGGRQTTGVRWAGKYAADVVVESWLRTGGNFEPVWSAPAVVATGICHPNWLRRTSISRGAPLQPAL